MMMDEYIGPNTKFYSNRGSINSSHVWIYMKVT